MKSNIRTLLFICFLFPILDVSAAFYTVDQSMIIPGMPGCQLLLISIWDDMNTSDRSDDRHMRTDAFLRCGNQMNPIPGGGNFEKSSDNFSNSNGTLLPSLNSFFLSILELQITEDDREFVNHLIKKMDSYSKASNSGDKSIFIDLSLDLPQKFNDRIEYHVGFTTPANQGQEPVEFKEIKH